MTPCSGVPAQAETSPGPKFSRNFAVFWFEPGPGAPGGSSPGPVGASERPENGKLAVFPGNRVFGPPQGCLGQVPGLVWGWSQASDGPIQGSQMAHLGVHFPVWRPLFMAGEARFPVWRPLFMAGDLKSGHLQAQIAPLGSCIYRGLQYVYRGLERSVWVPVHAPSHKSGSRDCN